MTCPGHKLLKKQINWKYNTKYLKKILKMEMKILEMDLSNKVD